MELNLENKIKKLITNHQLHTITVDVFDTIIKYDYWPTDLRYLDLAARWQPTMQHFLTPKLTSTEIYEWFSHAERALVENHITTRIDILLETIVDSICQKYNLKISEEDKIDLFATLISIEIQFELQVSKPNEKLAAILRNIKQSHSEIKIYFIARSHLVADQIRILLHSNHLDDIFDDGVSSSELTPVTSDQKLFEQLPLAFGPSFELKHNLHIGDQRHPDFLAPRQCNSLAIHYRPIRFRGLRTLVGNTWFQLTKYATLHREYVRLNPHHQDPWYYYGLVLGEIDQNHRQHILQLAAEHPNTTYLLTNCLNLVLDENDLPSNLQICPDLNKITILRAFIWLLATYESDRWDAGALLKTLAQLQNLSRAELYSICFKNYNYSFLAINSFSDEAFWPHFLQEIRQADPVYTSKLVNDYNFITELISQNQNLTIIQANPDRTAELLQNFQNLFNINNSISTCALDYSGQIRNILSKVPNLTTSYQKTSFANGMLDAAEFIQQTELYPDDYYTKVLLPELNRIVKLLIKISQKSK